MLIKPLATAFFAFAIIIATPAVWAAKQIKTSDFSGWMEGYDTFTFSKERNAFLFFNEEKRGSYHKLLLDSVVIYSLDAEQHPVVAKKAAAHLEQGMRDLLARKGLSASEPGPGTARLKLAITGVEKPQEGLKAYHALPVAGIFRGAQAVSGKAATYIDTQFEGEVTDSVSGERVMAIVAKGILETDKRSGDELSFEDVQPTLDLWLERYDETLDEYLAKQ